jgi:sulfite reductase alpha subunit-like flavoprotein
MDLEKQKKVLAPASTKGNPTYQGESRALMIYDPPVEPEPPTICEQVKEDLPGVEEHHDDTFPPSVAIPIPDSTEVMLVENKRLTPHTHWQDVRELTFIMSAEYDYDPGETVTIYPKNFPEDVQALIDLMDWNDVADKALHFKAQWPNLYLDDYLITGAPGLYPLDRTTLRELLIHNLDITAIPKRNFFNLIAQHTNDPTHRARLIEFSDHSYTDEFYDYTTRPRRSILEVLQDFPSVKIPWQFVCTFFPVIRGREYSIASGGTGARYMPNRDYIQFQIIVALVKYRTVLKKVRQGLCSRYIASLPEGTDLNVQFKAHEKFYEQAQENPEYPLILIAPGTGLAPARSLIWEREHLSVAGKVEVGKSYLFYGGRNKDADFFYADEWENYDALQVEVFTAFSRDQPEKIYIQDIIRKQGELIERLIREEDAIIYVCGSSGKMPKAVREALIDACHKHNPTGRSRERIEMVFDRFEKEGRYIQETW